MQSASETPSSHSRRAGAQPERAPGRCSWRSCGPERGEPGHNQVVAIARVLSAAGAPDRYHER